MLYIYSDAAGQQLKAIYFANEGQVIQHDVSTPTPSSVVFSQSQEPAPQAST